MTKSGKSFAIPESKGRNNKLLFALTPLAAGVLTATQAPAQDLEEIIVTATRRAQSVQDIPYNISAYSADQLEKNRVDDIVDIARFVPGMNIGDKGLRDSSATYTSTLTIRGVNVETTSAVDFMHLSVPTVSMYVDDTPLFFGLQFNDLERVEVLRGPQGTLYGSGSLGGTIRFIHNKPDASEFDAKVNISGSNTKESGDGVNYNFDGMINLPLGDNMAFRASAGFRREAGVVDAPRLFVTDSAGVPILADPSDPTGSAPVTFSKNNVDDAEVYFVRAALQYEQTDWLTARFTYHHQETDTDGRMASSPLFPGFDQYEAAIQKLEPSEQSTDLFSLDIEVDVGFATFTSATSYYENDTYTANDATAFYKTALAGGYYAGVPRIHVAGDFWTDEEAWIQEARLVSNTEGFVDWTLGLFYSDQQLSFFDNEEALGISTAVSGAPGLIDERLFVIDRSWDFTDMAIFGEITLNLSDAWQVTGGVRGFHQKFTTQQLFLLPFCGAYCSNDEIDPLGSTLGDPTTDKETDVLFKANTSYDITEEHTAYFTFSQGFRRGGANSLPTGGLFAEDPALLSYKPDEVNNYEVGVKGKVFDSWSYIAAAFWVQWKDAQLFTTSPNAFADMSINANDARTRGIELEIAGQATDSLDVFLGYAFIDAELTEDLDFAGKVGFKGDRLPGSPKHNLVLGGDYRYDLAGDMSLVFHVDGVYTSGRLVALNDLDIRYRELDGFWLWDAELRLEAEQWQASFFVDNVFDEFGVTAGQSVRRNGLAAFDWFARPRTMGINVSYNF